MKPLLYFLISISLWGCERDEIKDAVISSYNSSEKVSEFIILYSQISFDSIPLYLTKVYPQYKNGNIEKHDKFAYITLFDRITIKDYNLKLYYDTSLSQKNTCIYTVVWNPFSVKTAYGHD